MSLEVANVDASKGWTLWQTLERITDPGLWDAYLAAQAESEKVPRSIGRLSVGRTPGEARAMEAFSAASEAVERSLRELLSTGALGSTGSRGDVSVAPSLIYREGWQSLRILDYEKSVVQERTGSKGKIHNVRIFPLIHAADAAAQLSGCSLVEVFWKCILQDPELIAAAKRIPEREQYEPVFKEGQSPGPYVEFDWPLDWTASNLAAQFVKPVILNNWPEPSPPIQHVATVIIDRLHRLRQRLVDGELVARGTFVRTGMVQYIDPLQWVRPGLWIDVRGGDLLEEEQRRPVARWTGLSLLRPQQRSLGQAQGGFHNPMERTDMFHVEPPTFDGVRSSTIEPQPVPKKRSLVAVEARKVFRKVCAAWLEGIMRASPHERTESKESLWAKAKQKWPEMSERTFIAAWDDAVVNSGAIAWSASGAPRKALRKESSHH